MRPPRSSLRLASYRRHSSSRTARFCRLQRVPRQAPIRVYLLLLQPAAVICARHTLLRWTFSPSNIEPPHTGGKSRFRHQSAHTRRAEQLRMSSSSRPTPSRTSASRSAYRMRFERSCPSAESDGQSGFRFAGNISSPQLQNDQHRSLRSSRMTESPLIVDAQLE